MKRKVDVVEDLNGKKIVFIQDILFKGRQNINWDDVENYIKNYIGEFIKNVDSGDIIYMGTDLPDEYTGSKYTEKLKGTLAKAKANAVQGLPEMIEIAENKRFKVNLTQKHNRNAEFGWYRYDTRFALPVFDENGEIERYNIFKAELIVRHASDRKLYLYDVINAKKETGTPL